MDIHEVVDEAVEDALYEQAMADWVWENEREFRRQEWQSLLKARRLLKAYPTELQR